MTSTPRRQLKPRQVETVQKLLDGGLRQLDEVGAEALTIRQVALQAGVSPATAYTYFSSRGHLVAELFARMLAEDAVGQQPVGETPTRRVQWVTRHLTDLLEGAPELAAAVTVALLGSDPDVDRLRLHIGAEFVSRFEEALGEAATPDLVESLTFAFSGALLQAGMGLVSYAELGDRLDGVVATILEGTVAP